MYIKKKINNIYTLIAINFREYYIFKLNKGKTYYIVKNELF